MIRAYLLCARSAPRRKRSLRIKIPPTALPKPERMIRDGLCAPVNFGARVAASREPPMTANRPFESALPGLVERLR